MRRGENVIAMGTLAHLTLVFNQGGKNMTCGLDFEKGAAIDLNAGDLQAMAQAAYDSFAAAGGLKTQYVSAQTLQRVEAYAYDIAALPSPPPPPAAQFHRVPVLGPYISVGAPVAGTWATGGAAPPNVALVWSFYSNLIARRGRGRAYTPPPPEQTIDTAGEVDSTWISDTATKLLDIVTDVEASIAPDLLEHVVVSLRYNGTEDVVTYKLRDRVDTQRRRLIRNIDN